MAGALDGVRVIDFGQYIAGPLLGMLLADQGAEVVRVDPPGGPRWQTPANRVWNRGKESVLLDLKSRDGLQIARELVSRADVLIENFRPGVMDRLGLGFDFMQAANLGLIYCSLPGFADDDPRAPVAAWEGVVGASTGTYRARLEGGEGAHPVYTAIPISSSYAAFLGAASVAAALNARARDGLGQRVQVPLFDATFTAIGLVGQKYADPSRITRRGGGAAWVRQYRCGDGRWVQFHAANTRFIEQFAAAAGIEGWRADGLFDRRRFLEEPALEQELAARMEALFLTRTAAEWEELVNAAGTPTAVCRESQEWLAHPHARATGMVFEGADPELGRLVQPGITPRLESTPARPKPAAAPGADTTKHALEAAKERPPMVFMVKPTISNAGPLAGIKVIDLCIILAGPTCGRTLAEFGADVIKIDAPDREGGVAFHEDVNRGKKSLLLDLKRPEGLDVFWRLVEDADVVVQNYRAGAVDRLGIGYEEVRKRKPSIVYASLNCYGHGGPWEQRPGWEQLAQATTGMQMRYGGDHPVLQPYPVNDYGTGILGAYGVMLALHERQRTGQGQHVHSALAYTACALQSAFLVDFDGKVWDEPRGQDALGSSALHRLYEASDAWLFLGARETDIPALERVLECQLPDDDAGRAVAIAAAIRAGDCNGWVERLRSAGIGAHAALTVENVMEDPWAQSHGLSLWREHAGPGLLRTNGPGQRLSRTSVVPGTPAPVPGADAADVLAAHGLGSQLASLVAQGVVALPGKGQ